MSILLSILPAFAFGAQDTSSRTKASSTRSRSTTAKPFQTVQSQVETAPSPVTERVWRMKKAEIKDRLAEGNEDAELTAMSMLIPNGWTLQGAPEYPATADCNFTYGRIRLHASSPDGLTGIRVIPMTATVWSDNRAVLQEIHRQNQVMADVQQVKIEPPKPISQILLEAVRRLQPGSQVERSPEPMPELSGRLKPMLAQINRRLAKQAAATGIPTPRMSAKAARVRVSWLLDGERIEAWVVALQTVNTERLQIGGNFVTNDVPLLAVLHAPEGKLDGVENMLTAMLGSVQLHPEWQAAVARANRRRIQKVVDAQTLLNQPSAAYQFSLNPLSVDGVQLWRQAGRIWISSGNANEYIWTDSASYDPNDRVSTGKWTEFGR